MDTLYPPHDKEQFIRFKADYNFDDLSVLDVSLKVGNVEILTFDINDMKRYNADLCSFKIELTGAMPSGWVYAIVRPGIPDTDYSDNVRNLGYLQAAIFKIDNNA